MSLTKLSLGGNNDIIYKELFPPRESLVSDIPAGDGNIEKVFFAVYPLPQSLENAGPFADFETPNDGLLRPPALQLFSSWRHSG